MRIAQIAPLWENIPPEKYGGTERIVHSLTEGLVREGHDVTLFACGTSKTSAKLVSVYPHPLISDNIPWTNVMYPLLNITEAFDRHGEFDIIHVHLNKPSDYLALPLARPIAHKVVFTLHFPHPHTQGRNDRAEVLNKYKDLNFISISDAQRAGGEDLNWIGTVYNGVAIDQFTFNPHPKEYVLWLGKFNPDKGTKEAILAAKKAGKTILVAGAIDSLEGDDKAYYENEIKPLLNDTTVRYIGELDQKEKDKVYGEAYAFLNPIQWNEPFGLVMAEAMAAGTPVISFRNGAAPEIIIDGKTGFLVDTVDEMVQKIAEIPSINRADCRARVEAKFTESTMVKGYSTMYSSLYGKTQR